MSPLGKWCIPKFHCQLEDNRHMAMLSGQLCSMKHIEINIVLCFTANILLKPYI